MQSKLAGLRLARLAAGAFVATLAACGGGEDGGSVSAAGTFASAGAQAAQADASAAAATGVEPARWLPSRNDTWQIQLQGKVNTSYNVTAYDVDLFDTTQASINALKAQGRKVVCYFSAGSSEDWRPDFSKFKAADMGKALDGWAGERWLDTRSANVRSIMKARMDLAKSKGCDGIDPDNVDGYTNKPGFPLTAATQLDYNRFLAAEGHARGLAVGLKNSIDQLGDLASSFDFAVNEQCYQYSECGGYSAFTAQGKPVLNIEYQAKYKDPATLAKLCAKSRAANLYTLILPLALDGKYRYSCD